MLVLRTRNQTLVLGKKALDNTKVNRVTLSFFTATSYDPDKKADGWLRGKSRFNIAVNHLAMSEQNLGFIFQLMNTYTQVFEKEAEKVKLWTPEGFHPG